MFLLNRYILRAHAGPFIFGFSIVLFLFLMQFIMKTIDQLVGKGLSEWVIVQLITLNLAWMVVLAVPMGVLFATLMAFGAMSAAHEITIIKASGGSLYRMMLPVAVFGLALSFWLFWFNDDVLPDANHKAKTLFNDIRKKKPTFALEAGQYSTQLDGYTILARSLDSASGLLRGVTIYDNTKSGLVNIVSSDTGRISFNHDYSKLIMTLTSGEIHQSPTGLQMNYRRVKFSEYIIRMNASGFAFERSEGGDGYRGDRELRISDMREIVSGATGNAEMAKNRIDNELSKHFNYITGKLVTSEPYEPQMASFVMSKHDTIADQKAALSRVQRRLNILRSTVQSDLFQEAEYKLKIKQYEVEIHKKYAIPFACFVFVFVGCPLGIITRGGNFGLSGAISLGFYIFYWACLIGGEKLADRGIVSPFVSMWLGNMVIGIIGILLTIKINNESLAFARPIKYIQKIISGSKPL